MLIHLCSDLHADASTSGLDRFDEIREGALRVANAAIDEKRDGKDSVFVFGGDLCDPDTSRAFRAVGLAIEIAILLSRRGVPSLWIAGNHDVIENDRGATVLEPLIEAAKGRSIMVFEQPGSVCVGGVIFVMLPYVARANHYDPDRWIEEHSALPHPAERLLVVGHLTVPGAERGSESDDFARGRDLVFPVDACRKRWGERAILANGHYHRAQTTREGVHIPGSLARLRHDEERHEPGYLVFEI